jgi:hypothetical protein
MCEVAGRPIVAALHMLLSAERLFTVEPARRLPAILRESRKYQNQVSTALAEQVLAALNELLRGFQAANESSKDALLGEVLASDPNHVYGGLLASLMRLVFVLYAEDRGLLSPDSIYVNSYSLKGLFERLREDAARYPDNMDQRYGAWSQLLTLFRLVYDGAKHGAMHLPARQGELFDPDSYPFLEGRPYRSRREAGERLQPPRVSDGVMYRVLTNLLLLDGEQLSYRTLDVEQIGSVYEAMMGYELLVATGPSVGLRPDNVVVNLDDLLRIESDKRQKRLHKITGCELKGQAVEQLELATKTEDLLSALGKKISGLTPYVVPKGGMFLQPTDERRRSGSDYTPRSLTEPIVSTTLKPIFERFGEHPRPEQILDLKICDPAMGSGAFLVEVCRFLGEKLVEAWNHYEGLPSIPPDEDPSLFARRLIAQRCLYGVDVNRFATDLAKLSLWLATLAKDHPFTFLDHALRSGDSLVGFDRLQIAQFHWDKTRVHERVFGQEQLERAVERVTAYRKEILDMTEDDVASILLKQQKLDLADQALQSVRRAGDLLVAAFFNASKDKERDNLRGDYRDLFLSSSHGNLRDLQKENKIVNDLRGGKVPVIPFHWEIEFPEVFDRQNPGFDAFVGNPPFAGKNTFIKSHRSGYLPYLQVAYEESHGNADLVAYFFRRSFNLVRSKGNLGLIATNTIAQGDTRSTGLRWICTHQGTIYAARKRVKWPGRAAVVVSVVHIEKAIRLGPFDLDGRSVSIITAYLFHAGGHENPATLNANQAGSFNGTYVLGMGFTFDNTDKKGIATPIAEMRQLIAKDPRNEELIFPYIGGEEVNESPTHGHHRYIINFEDWPLQRDTNSVKWQIASEEQHKLWLQSGTVPSDYPHPVAADFPDLLHIVRAKVKPDRDEINDANGKKFWWRYMRRRQELYSTIRHLPRVLVTNCGATPHLAITFLPTGSIYANTLVIFPFDSYSVFAILQSRVHEVWARLHASSMKDDLRYTPSDCFESFPLPPEPESDAMRSVGEDYYGHRAGIMLREKIGLTAIYNHFHEPESVDVEVETLRKVHDRMDRAILDAYGWTDIKFASTFFLDYKDDEDEGDDSHRKKKPWRYRWPDEIRDEVLARLLELNRVRAEEEQLAGVAAEAQLKLSSDRKLRRSKKRDSDIGNLLVDVTDEGKS